MIKVSNAIKTAKPRSNLSYVIQPSGNKFVVVVSDGEKKGRMSDLTKFPREIKEFKTRALAVTAAEDYVVGKNHNEYDTIPPVTFKLR